MLKRAVWILLKHTFKFAVAFLLMLTAIFFLLSELGQTFLVQLDGDFVRPNLANFALNQLRPLVSFDSNLSWWTRYTLFVENVFRGDFGLSPIDMAANVPLVELLVPSWIRSLLMFALALLVAVPAGRKLSRTFSRRTHYRVWACGLMALSLPAWTLGWLWLFNQVFDNFPRGGPVEMSLNATLWPLAVILGGSLLLAWSAKKLSQRAWLTPASFRHWFVGLGVFLISLLLMPFLFGGDVARILLDLFRYTLLPMSILVAVSTAMYLLFLGSRFLGPDRQNQPAWGLFISLTVTAQVFLEAAFNWKGIGESFYDIAFSTPRWRLMVGSLIGIGLWLLLAHWVRGMAVDLKQAPQPQSPPNHQASPLPFHRDAKLLFLGNFLFALLLLLLFANPFIPNDFPFSDTLRRTLSGGVTTFVHAVLAGLVAVALGGLAWGVYVALKPMQWRWLPQSISLLAGGWLGVPWLVVVVFWFYLSLPSIGSYPLAQASVMFGIAFWPIAFFIFKHPPVRKNAHVLRKWSGQIAAAMLLVVGLAVSMEALVNLIGWRPQPSGTWGIMIQNGYINEVLATDFRRPFWLVSLGLSLLSFTSFLLALELRGVGQSSEIP